MNRHKLPTGRPPNPLPYDAPPSAVCRAWPTGTDEAGHHHERDALNAITAVGAAGSLIRRFQEHPELAVDLLRALKAMRVAYPDWSNATQREAEEMADKAIAATREVV